MSATQIIDLALTPAAAGIAAGFGLRGYARQYDEVLPRIAPVLVGVAVAGLLLGWKLSGGAN